MRQAIPLCLLRIWCRKSQAWIYFETKKGERYQVSASGYFIELPDGTMSTVGVRQAFSIIDKYPSLRLIELVPQGVINNEHAFLKVARPGGSSSPITVDEVATELDDYLPMMHTLRPIERYIALRMLEHGLVPMQDLRNIIDKKGSDESLGEVLLNTGLVTWEPLLAACLDMRALNRLDPLKAEPQLLRKEWELSGEILISMGKISRTKLERALKIKRDANQAIGEILASMGACSKEDVDKCLRVQSQLREDGGFNIAQVGDLLVEQGIISQDDLNEALRHQKVARQSLDKILMSMGAINHCDLEHYKDHSSHSMAHREEIDEYSLGSFLVREGVITDRQLQEAQNIQLRGRQVLGELLISLGMCTREQVDYVVSLQKNMRKDYKTDQDKLGTLLVKRRIVSPQKVEEAAKIQTLGRKRLGAILISLGFVTANDYAEALEIQYQWRDKQGKQPSDELGEELVAAGVISDEQRTRALGMHLAEGKPLGGILVREGYCTPEHVIEALLLRDQKRKSAFAQFVREQIGITEPPVVSKQQEQPQSISAPKKNFVDKLSSWIKKPAP